jgi:hypothetical protein
LVVQQRQASNVLVREFHLDAPSDRRVHEILSDFGDLLNVHPSGIRGLLDVTALLDKVVIHLHLQAKPVAAAPVPVLYEL